MGTLLSTYDPLPALEGGVSTVGVSGVTPSLGVTKNPSKAGV